MQGCQCQPPMFQVEVVGRLRVLRKKFHIDLQIFRDFLLVISDCFCFPPGNFENYPLHMHAETGCSL